jgi:hypothetical protein
MMLVGCIFTCWIVLIGFHSSGLFMVHEFQRWGKTKLVGEIWKRNLRLCFWGQELPMLIRIDMARLWRL